MDGNIAERDDIAPFHVRVRLTKGLREAGSRFTNHGELLERRGLMEFAGQKGRGIHACQKGLKHVAGLEDVLQVEALTPHIALGQSPAPGLESPALGHPWVLDRLGAPRGLRVRVAFWPGAER